MQEYAQLMAAPARYADGLDHTAVQAPTAQWFLEGTTVGENDLDLVTVDANEQVYFADATPAEVIAPETSLPIEIWEGVVNRVLPGAMEVTLRPTLHREAGEQVMELDTAFVQPQDRDLVCPGAVFYLTMYKQTTRRTIRNTEDITFRRRPDWTAAMFNKLDELTALL